MALIHMPPPHRVPPDTDATLRPFSSTKLLWYGTQRQVLCVTHLAQVAALAQLDEAWQRFDLLLAPAAKGEAPAGLGNTGDLLMPFGVIAILAVLVFPLPTWLLDISLALSITLSVIILMTVLFIQKALEINARIGRIQCFEELIM